jgi:hypothetical protein
VEEDVGGECRGEGYCDSSCVNSAWDGVGVQADEGHGEGGQGEQGAISRKVGKMESGVTGKEVKDIVLKMFWIEEMSP